MPRSDPDAGQSSGGRLCRGLLAGLAAMLLSGFAGDAPHPLSKFANPAGSGARVPRLMAMPGGGVLMSWVEPAADGHALKFGVLRDGQWLRQGQAATGRDWFVNWGDYPSVVAIDDTFWMAHWLVRQTGGRTYDYDVALAISTDAGKSWRNIGSPHRDGVAAEHGFAAIFPVGDTAGIVWLDGRDYVKPAERAQHPDKSGNFSLRYTRVHRDGHMDAETVLDANTCSCCWPAATVAGNGVVAVWRGRTEQDIRDHRVAKLAAGRWSAPRQLGEEGWHIEGCPTNGAAVAARGNQVAVVWFTAQGDRPRVRAAFSMDGGERFGLPIDVDVQQPLGRVALAWLDDQHVALSWMSQADQVTKQSSIVLRKIRTDGTMAGDVRHLADVSAGRETGVPQLASDGGRLVWAWTSPAPAYGVVTIAAAPDALQPMASSFSLQQAVPGLVTPYICQARH